MKKCLILLFAAALIVATVMPAVAETKNYDGKDWWDKDWETLGGGLTLVERMQEGGEMDVDRFINSGQGETFMKAYTLQRKYKDGTEPEVIKYWADKGIVKVYEGGTTRPRWVAYVPKEALAENNTKKFPLIFQLPHANLFNAEGRGYAELAAKERLIVVIPTHINVEEIYRYYLLVVNKYPVDTSRFYVTGFSYTGFRTEQFALRHPEVVAGIAVNSHLWPFSWELPEKWLIDHSASLKMPLVQYVGNADFGQPLPINSSYTPDADARMQDDHLHVAQDGIDRANMWFRINDVPRISYRQSMATANSKNKVEREIGAPVSRSKIERHDDTEYYIGDFISSDGVYRTRLISMDNCFHFPFGSMAEVTWEFLKHFSREIETGETLIDGEFPL